MSNPQRLLAAYETARDRLLAERTPNGHWVGELATSALSTATAVSALALVERHDATDGKGCLVEESRESRLSELIVKGIRWLAEHQNDDGGWGDTEKSYSNIATTMLAVAAFHLTSVPADHADLLERAEQYIDKNGRIDGLRRRYGKDKTFAVPILTNCALAGLVPWKEVAPLPFEAACVPQRFYHLLKLPVVSYAIPALVGIGQARYFHKKPWNPIARLVRKMAVAPSLKVLRRMQPQSGGYLEAVPLTSFVVMSLAGTGRVDHAVVQSGVQFLIDSVRPDGSWPIDTNLATWNTTLSVNALAAGGEDVAALDIHPTATQGKRLEVVNSGSPEGTAAGGLGREPQENVPDSKSSPEGATQRDTSKSLSPLRGSGSEFGDESWGSRPRLPAAVPSGLPEFTTSRRLPWVAVG
jgi:squalene-hopene/tetraprenyl-beta-curcumene cyclase